MLGGGKRTDRKVEADSGGNDRDGQTGSWSTSSRHGVNTEAVGAITVEYTKASAQRLHEEIPGAWNMRSQWEQQRWKGTNSELERDRISLAENRQKRWEELMSALHSGCGWMQGKSENCNSIINPELLFHTG
jgi:hypothetical protein